MATVGVGVLIATATVWSQSNLPAERYTAVAVDMGGHGSSSIERIEIVVDRWSGAAQRDRLLSALFQGGQDKMLDALLKLPRIGYIRAPGQLGYDLRFGQQTPLAEGGKQILLITDRYISFWEAANQPRSINYPFTVIELRANREGDGEGRMTIATRIGGDEKTRMIFLEDFGIQPVQLSHVRRQK
jgi:hypothetical protein